MDIRKVLVLRGPNLWARFPVLEAYVDLGALKDSPSDEMPGFNERLMGWLPTMIEHRCSVGERGGFFQRLRRGTYLAHILEHVTLELQCLAGSNVGYGRARETAEEGVYKVVVRYREEDVGRAALETARQLCLAAVYDLPFDVAAEVAKLRKLLLEVQLGPSTRAIVEAAQARGIPVRRLNAHSLVQLGHGASQRRIIAAETDGTSAIAEAIAQDKDLTRTLLQAVGVPVPKGRVVSDASDAWTAALEIGLPVVVKPQNGNQGRGVATNLTTREQVLTAYEVASREEAAIIVETHAPGGDYRLLVVDGRVVAAARREPAHVVGDGIHTIAELVEIANNDPRRGDDHATPLSKICLDEVSLSVLADQQLAPPSVPDADRVVLIRRNANLSTGGTAADVTDLVHPEVAARAVEAARVVGLDIAGVDVVANDIGRPLEEQGGVIVEVNAGPGLRMHVQPSSGQGRPVGEAIVASLFGPDETGHIPVVGVTGTNGKTTTARYIAHLLRFAGRSVGMTCTEGIFVNGRRIESGDCSGPQSAVSVLSNPLIDAAVLETARGGILRAGLAYDRCDVAVVTNIGDGDHLGIGGIKTAEEMAVVKRTLVDAVPPQGWAVLKADDPLVAAMAEHCKGSVIFCAWDAEHPVVAAHRAAGGRAAFVRNRHLVLAEGPIEHTLISLGDVPIARDGRVGFMVENALAAAAAGWSLGLPLLTIRAGMQSFDAQLDSVPGRFNLLQIDGATVVLDYVHNISALSAVIKAIGSFPHERRIAVYTAAGDRRDCEMIRQGELLGDAFDQVILYEDHYRRGRAPGEIMAFLRRGLAAGKRVKEVREIGGAINSARSALDALRPGDLVLLQADEIDETVEFMRNYQASRPRHVLVNGVEADESELEVAKVRLQQPAAALAASDPTAA